MIVMDLFHLAYYLSLFAMPIVFYMVFIKGSTSGKYSKPTWYYVLKMWFARPRVRAIQEEHRNALRGVPEDVQERAKRTLRDNETDTQAIYGADVKGNLIVLKLILRRNLQAEVSIEFRLNSGKVYRLPSEPQVVLCSLHDMQWKAQGLTIQVLEPFRRLRITYNGLLRNVARNDAAEEVGEIEHVQFHFIWNSASAPLHYPQDTHLNLLTDAVAREPWRNGDWINALGSDCGYQQYGALKGFVKGSAYAEEVVFNMPSWRRRHWGCADAVALKRDFFLFAVLDDGTLFAVGAKSLRRGCTQLRYGSILCDNGDMYCISGSDISLEYLADNKEVPNIFTIHFEANGKTYKCVSHLRLDKLAWSFSGETAGWESKTVAAECDVGVSQARAVATFWYSRQGQDPASPEPFLREQKTDIENVYIADLCSEECRDLSLTGGKGNSLALLTSVSTSEFVVPQGFVITVAALRRHLEQNPMVRSAIDDLEGVCHGKVAGNIEEACKRTVDKFAQQPVAEEVARLVVREIDDMKRLPSKDQSIECWRWAVRSSGIGEDSDELSAAGQNSTFLGCTSDDDVLRAVSACWASLYAFQSVQYRRQHGQRVYCEMGVVVQRMVPADCAGVMFTCDPATNDPSRLVITSNYGLGESVVSASADPDTITLARTWHGDVSLLSSSVGSKKTRVVMSAEATEEKELDDASAEQLSLNEGQALRLGRAGVLVERLFGGPRDIEWAFYKDRLYLLQSRPITTLSGWTDFELLHEFDTPVLTESAVLTRANVGEVMKGALTVLSSSNVAGILERCMQQEAFQTEYNPYVNRALLIGLHHSFMDVLNMMYRQVTPKITLEIKILDLTIFGHVVFNDRLHKMALRRHGPFGGLKKWQMNKAMLEKMWNSKQVAKNAVQCNQMWILKFGEKENAKNAYEKIDDNVRYLVKLAEQHTHATRNSIAYQVVAMLILVGKNKELNDDHYHDISLLLSTNAAVESAEIPVILDEIATLLKKDDLADEFAAIDPKDGAQWLKRRNPKAAQIFDRFLEAHGHRLIREFELQELSWGMDPASVVSMIQSNCKTAATTKKAKGLTVDETIAKLISPKSKITRTILKFIVNKCRTSVALREKTKSEIVRGIHKFRLAYRQLAKKMVLEGYLPDESLVFHFTHKELKQVLSRNDPTLILKATRRKRLYTQWDNLTFPEIIFGCPVPEDSNSEKFDQIRRNPSGIKVQGTPVCRGSVVARACVIRDIKDAVDIQSGDILITYSTDIAWSPYFPLLSGVVTELGGLISHGAVVAREYGLPCIIGAEHATKYFKTGDKILLSGKTGVIELAE